MIIFHEGLPGSGKSYAAMKDQIIPAIQKGRKVYAYLEGIDDPECRRKIAEVAQLTIEEIDGLVFPLTREQVPQWHTICPKDCLVILDELQNFYPSGKQKLDDDTTRAVTEHRHKGQDILGMGQDLRDCHPIFKRRVDQKILFNKLDALGLVNRYSWQVCKSAGLERFEVVSKGVSNYDSKYFGTYKSHVEGADNKSTFVDKRANIFRSKFFRFVLPVAFVCGIFAAFKLYDVFHTGFATDKTKEALSKSMNGFPKPPDSVPPVVASIEKKEPPKADAKPKEPPLPSESITEAPQDRVQILSAKYRIRVGGFWEGRGKKNGFIEWRDESGTLRNRFSFDEMQGMGYMIMSNQMGTVVTLVNGPIHYIATMWAIDSNSGVVNQQQLENTRGNGSSSFGSPQGKPLEAHSDSIPLPVESDAKPNPRQVKHGSREATS